MFVFKIYCWYFLDIHNLSVFLFKFYKGYIYLRNNYSVNFNLQMEDRIHNF